MYESQIWFIGDIQGLGSDHVQLSKMFWKIEAVLAVNKKTESELELSVFHLVPKHIQFPKTLYSIAHDLTIRFR